MVIFSILILLAMLVAGNLYLIGLKRPQPVKAVISKTLLVVILFAGLLRLNAQPEVKKVFNPGNDCLTCSSIIQESTVEVTSLAFENRHHTPFYEPFFMFENEEEDDIDSFKKNLSVVNAFALLIQNSFSFDSLKDEQLFAISVSDNYPYSSNLYLIFEVFRI